MLLRYIARVASLPNFYGQNAYESGQVIFFGIFFKLFSVNVLLHSNPAVASSQIDEWLEYAPVFLLGPAFENACKYVDDFLQSRTFLVGYCFSIADVAIWSTLAGTTFGDCLFISFLVRHF